MINNFRAAANSAPIRILLLLVAAAFVLYGVGDVIRGRNEFSLVKFRNLDNIGLNEFYKAKKDAISQIQQSMNLEVTPELMEQINLDHQVITSLIKKRIFGAWINASDIKISDKVVVDYIKTVPRFLDEDKKFNMAKFKDFLSRLSVSEEEFYQDLEHSIAENLLEKLTENAVYMPKLLEEIVINSLSEVKTADIIKVRLDEKASLPEIKPSDDELMKYYEDNSDIFRTSEKRSVKYIKIGKTETSKTQNDSDPAEKAFAEEIRKLEDYVAAGDNLSEIAARYNVNIASASGDMAIFEKMPELSDFAEQIFSMKEQEVSYPLNLNDGQNIILFEIENVKEGQIPSFVDVKNDVKKEYLKKSYVEANIAMLKTIEQNIKEKGFSAAIKESGLPVYSTIVARATPDTKLPEEVAAIILRSATGDSSDLILLEDYGYIFNITNSSIDKKEKEIISASKIPSIRNHFKASFIESALEYFYNRNLPDVRMEILGGE